MRILFVLVVGLVLVGCAEQEPMTPEQAQYQRWQMQQTGAALQGLSQQLQQQRKPAPGGYRGPTQTNCTMQPDGFGGWRQSCQQW